MAGGREPPVVKNLHSAHWLDGLLIGPSGLSQNQYSLILNAAFSGHFCISIDQDQWIRLRSWPLGGFQPIVDAIDF